MPENFNEYEQDLVDTAIPGSPAKQYKTCNQCGATGLVWEMLDRWRLCMPGKEPPEDRVHVCAKGGKPSKAGPVQPEPSVARFVQLTSCDGVLYALDTQGSVWELNHNLWTRHSAKRAT